MPNKRADDQVVTSVALPRDLLDRVRAEAARRNVPASVVIRDALERYVKRR